MKITLVKKIMENGEECKKCAEVTDRLKAGSELEFIDNIVFADMRDQDAEGNRLAEKYNVDIAPFFIVEESGSVIIYKTYMELKKKVLKKALDQADTDIEAKRIADDELDSVDFL